MGGVSRLLGLEQEGIQAPGGVQGAADRDKTLGGQPPGKGLAKQSPCWGKI